MIAARVAAERHPDPDLARSLADLVGEHAVDAHRGQQQRDGAERERQQHRRAPRVAATVPTRSGIERTSYELQLRIDVGDRPPDRRRSRRHRIAAAS